MGGFGWSFEYDGVGRVQLVDSMQLAGGVDWVWLEARVGWGGIGSVGRLNAVGWGSRVGLVGSLSGMGWGGFRPRR